MKLSASHAGILARFLLVPVLAWGTLGLVACTRVQGQDVAEDDIGADDVEDDEAEGAVTEGRQLGRPRLASTLGVNGHTTQQTSFRGRLAGNVARGASGEGAEAAEEEEFSENDFQGGDADEAESPANLGGGGGDL